MPAAPRPGDGLHGFPCAGVRVGVQAGMGQDISRGHSDPAWVIAEGPNQTVRSAQPSVLLPVSVPHERRGRLRVAGSCAHPDCAAGRCRANVRWMCRSRATTFHQPGRRSALKGRCGSASTTADQLGRPRRRRLSRPRYRLSSINRPRSDDPANPTRTTLLSRAPIYGRWHAAVQRSIARHPDG